MPECAASSDHGDVARRVSALNPDPLDLIDSTVIERSWDGVIRSWNSAAERLYGWDRGEAIGLRQSSLLQCDPQVALDDIQKIMLETGHWSGELTRRTKEGAGLRCNVAWHLKRDASGVVSGILEIGHSSEALFQRDEAAGNDSRPDGAYSRLFKYVPISLWKINSQRLRGEFARLREAGVTDLALHLEQTPSEITRLMDLVTVEDVNDKTIEMFGGSKISDFYGPVTRFWQPTPGTFCRSICAQFGGATSYAEESLVATLDGREIHILYKIAAPPLHDGQAMSIVSVVDISDLVEAHRKLKESEARYRNLFQNFDVALLQLDMRAMFAWQNELKKQGVADLPAYAADHPEFFARAMELITVTEGNAQAIKLFGAKSAEELHGPVTFCWQTTPGTFARSVLTRLSGGARFSEETRINTLDGRVVDVLFTLGFPRQLTDAGINVVGFIDISERVAAQATVERIQAQFEQASRVSVLGELAASIAHEVNQPLAGIMACAEASLNWISKDAPDKAQLTELVNYIIDDAQRAADIVSGIRDMAANRQREFQDVRLGEVVEGALQILRHELVANNVSIQVEASESNPVVSVDQVQIQQVIVNLAMNAMQAMSQTPSPRLTVTIEEAGVAPSVAYVTVSDNGPGIALDVLPRIFESLYTTKAVGLGMGLSICQRIVKSHHGTLTAANMPGGGASFRFSLPIAAR